ncbi:MAG: DUF1501 domain-containing protein [Acidobacteria bacterium]|nr:DUF1501 domain-containing protein [Acidobacteriota bacterium]
MTPLHRRAFLGRTAAGFGLTALQSLLGAGSGLHHPAKAKRVIFLYQAGGPSHLELFDPKPKLASMHGQGMPESFTKGQQIAQLQGKPLLCFGPQFPFQRYGKSGVEISSLLPKIGGVIDDVCLVRSMWTEQINHDPAHTLMNTGSILAGRPSMGSWAVYGLGTEAPDLPGYVVMVSIQSVGDPVLYIENPRGVDAKMQQQSIQAITALQRLEQQALGDPEVQTRIAQYEMAYRMQSSVPGLMDFSTEPNSVLEDYGAKPGDGSFASNCLLARRLAERGVRFIQLYHRDWDHHGKLKEGVGYKAEEVDRPTAALIKDLKQRGLLDDTLVIWGGEFGRTPMSQGGDGRDHHIKGFSYLMAGAGIKAGTVYGSTDDLGYAAVDNPVSVHDLHATILHLLGINHLRLTLKVQGLDVRLTGISGDVVKGILS